ncbi:hypothetical protein CCP2SC5_80066 [Azospirillaceae bacterium]
MATWSALFAGVVSWFFHAREFPRERAAVSLRDGEQCSWPLFDRIDAEGRKDSPCVFLP